MKKSSILVIIMITILVATVLGLFRTVPAKTKELPTFDKIMETDKLALCYMTWPPSIIKDPNTGDLSGFIIDIVNEIAKESNLEVSYVESTWGGFSADLNTGKCDAAIAGVYPTIGRSTNVAFTEPFFYSGNSVAARTDETRFKKFEDLNQEGIKIAVIQGEYVHIYAKRYLPKATLVVLEKSSDLTMSLVAVTSGKADVALSTSETIASYTKRHPEIKDLFPNKPFATTPASWAVRKEDQALLNFLDNALRYLKATGFLEATIKEYQPEGMYLEKTEYSIP